MDLLAALIAALGLPATTKDADVVAAVTALKAKPPQVVIPTALATELSLQASATEAEVLAAVKSLKTTDAGATAAAMHALQTQVATLSAQLQGDQLTKLVDDAIKGNKLVPAQRDWALGWGKKDFAALKGFVDGAPVIPGLNGQSGGGDPGAGGATHALTDEQKAIATQLGLDPTKYAEHLAKNKA